MLTNESILELRSLGISFVVFVKGGFLSFSQFGKAKAVTGHLYSLLKFRKVLLFLHFVK